MILKGNEDPRIRRTITAIKDSFLQMMGEIPYEKITVRELSDRAGVNKKTFYYYYSSLDALLEEMQDELLDEYLQRIPMVSEGVLQVCIDAFFRFFNEKGVSAIRVVTRDHSGRVYRKLLELDRKLGKSAREYWEPLCDFAKKELITCFNSIILNGLSRWVEEGRPIPIEKAIDLTTRFSLTGIYGMLKIEPTKRGRRKT